MSDLGELRAAVDDVFSSRVNEKMSMVVAKVDEVREAVKVLVDLKQRNGPVGKIMEPSLTGQLNQVITLMEIIHDRLNSEFVVMIRMNQEGMQKEGGLTSPQGGGVMYGQF